MDEQKSATSGEVLIRTAERKDLPAIAEIYNHYVLHSTCTFATEPEDAAYWNKWFEKHTGLHPAIVAERGREVVGWGTLSTWNSRCAYRQTVENSVYVREGCRRGGIGIALMEELIRRARELRHRVIIAQIAGDQAASEELHRRMGFRKVGVLEGVGFKFEQWLDVALWQLQL
ncbi:MAG TPA: GNAT family N-acetyltransferase [Phycisphaerae bacterium]|nr:GNAT family N-acetyltransferase [Phycisphaerae bacterium]